ncbi:ABC-2 type transport system ATP-binding protein [Evansella caseinilytica]|uniref:ABC-2 type transport system ATP-binding protein n=1 Tax=Evansella caseinilytica TaxID=1503961 RepID=A0A1H3UTX0_9BACI|nr:ABC transporter ATP-binding protein [Evansella caseinilytica]SDZ65778.1 ABC-2 type transport system ATP-binding protein [Evansella caseinilytica]
MGVVELKSVTKNYQGNRGITDVTFTINEGEVFGFIGPNGAGKSTTIRTLLNFIHPTSGSATIFGKDIVKESKEIKKLVGYLPSEVHYYDDMKAIDLLKYSAGLHNYHNDKRIHELANKLQLDLNKKIEDLSFGNRKKVGIIQALLHEPKLLILDEPTGGLDPLMQNIFFDLLKEENKKGVTIFFSSHILSEVQKLCDRVAIIKEGELIKVEKVETLTQNNIKKVSLLLTKEANLGLNMEGILSKEKNGDDYQLLFNGEISSLLTMLAPLEVKDILIEEPTLDEIFMHYYK